MKVDIVPALIQFGDVLFDRPMRNAGYVVGLFCLGNTGSHERLKKSGLRRISIPLSTPQQVVGERIVDGCYGSTRGGVSKDRPESTDVRAAEKVITFLLDKLTVSKRYHRTVLMRQTRLCVRHGQSVNRSFFFKGLKIAPSESRTAETSHECEGKQDGNE